MTYPGQDAQGMLQRRLEQRGLAIARLHDLLDASDPASMLDPDGHPTPATADRVGGAIAAEIVRRWP